MISEGVTKSSSGGCYHDVDGSGWGFRWRGFAGLIGIRVPRGCGGAPLPETDSQRVGTYVELVAGPTLQ